MSDIVPEPHLLIQADNLEWLTEEVAKEEDSLRKGVDVCYLDPPYNTGNSNQTGFSYNDCFVGDTWTQFMRERLNLIKQLLKDTGVIAISIDDSEVHYLRVLMDEVFGRNNFIAQLTIDGGANKNQANFFSVTHDYMVIYAMNKNKLKKAKTKWRKRREGIELLLKEYEKQKKKKKTPEEITVHLKEWVKTQPLSKRLKVFYNADSKGLYTYADLSVPGTSYEYEVLHPETELPVQVPSRGWGLSEARFKELDEQGLILWGKDETYQPLKKLYLKDKKDQLMKSVLSYPSRSSTHLLAPCHRPSPSALALVPSSLPLALALALARRCCS
jgi:adenine-specific DNA-methyltransferase